MGLPIHDLAGVRVQGISRAGLETCIGLPDLGVAFDMGICPRSAVRLPTVLFTHAHVDHMAGVVHHCATRALQGMKPPTYVMPARVVPAFQKLRVVWQELDGSDLPCEVVGLAPGQELELPKGLVARPFATPHRVVSQGYVLYERRRKLLPELEGLAGQEIAQRRARGLPVTSEAMVPLVAFSGDSRIEGLLHHPDARTASLLMMEVTFLDERVSIDKTREKGHIHLDEVLAHADAFDNEAILFTHLSARYSPEQAQTILDERLPPGLWERVTLLTTANRAAASAHRR